MELIWINKAEYAGDYRLNLLFSNGEKKVFDASAFIDSYPAFRVLKDKSLFRDFELDGWIVSWQDGTLDIAPEYLYENGVAA